MNEIPQSQNEPKPSIDSVVEAVGRRTRAVSVPSRSDHAGLGRANRGFKSLVAWQRAMQLSFAVYELTAHFPATERLGLSSQMRRAAISVPANIAEGYGRATTGEFKQFLGHSRGSAGELETQLIIARHLHFGSADAIDQAEQLCGEVSRLLNCLMRSLKS